jgi:hypothetical protein
MEDNEYSAIFHLNHIHSELLVLPAKLVKSENRNVLKLPAEYVSKQALDRIIQKIEKLKPL